MQIENIIAGVILAVVLIGGGIYVNGFANWLVWAVAEAEAIFGSNTGKLKLRYAYELAVKRFPIFAKLIPFSVFRWLVDKALEVMRDMIENNVTIAEAIRGAVKEFAEAEQE